MPFVDGVRLTLWQPKVLGAVRIDGCCYPVGRLPPVDIEAIVTVCNICGKSIEKRGGGGSGDSERLSVVLHCKSQYARPEGQAKTGGRTHQRRRRQYL